MQKVEGSSPFIRSQQAPLRRGFSPAGEAARSRTPSSDRSRPPSALPRRRPAGPTNGLPLPGGCVQTAPIPCTGHGAVAEWLGSGLQSRVQRFESARRLNTGEHLRFSPVGPLSDTLRLVVDEHGLSPHSRTFVEQLRPA